MSTDPGAARDEPQGRWGREVERSRVRGHSCLVYARRPRSVSELLVESRRWDTRTFLVSGEHRLSYRHFEQAVGRVRGRLAGHGIRRGQRVVLLGHNSVEWLLAFWAVQCAGAVAVLGNVLWSEEETERALRTIEPHAIIADKLPVRGSASATTLGFDTLRPLIFGGNPSDDELASVDEDEPALIMFSSGTTGSAKGVVMSHRSVVANIHNLLVLTGRLPDEIPRDTPGTVSLLTMPFFHLAGIQIGLSTMLSGGTVVLSEGRFDPETVLGLIAREKVRSWGSVPTMVSRVLDHPRLSAFDLTSLRSIPMGGAPISPELRARIKESFPSVRSGGGSLYGLTEAGGVLAAGSGPEILSRPGCVGRPLPVVELRIDGSDPAGTGEIMARTPTLTSGYWGDEQPIADEEGWIRTGDLGRLDEDGYLYVVGRSKDIIIRGGENIASQHVERCLLQHAAVAECAVVPLPHPDLGEEVAAIVTLQAGTTASADELRKHALAHLGRFQVPSRWWLRREPLPTNASGKILKRELVESFRDVAAC